MTNNKYIKVSLDNRHAIRLKDVSLSLLGIYFQNVDVKIDTGCPYSTITMNKLNMTASELTKHKKDDAYKLYMDITWHMNNGDTLVQAVNKEIMHSFKVSYGIESGGRTHRKINYLNVQDIINADEISFKHRATNIIFNGVSISDKEVYLNYDRRGNILIGMDILKDWDIHMGTIDSGETIFLGCPKDQINDEYLQELERTFHIASDINAMFIRNKIAPK